MPQLIDAPMVIQAAGNKPKRIEEYIGRVRTETPEISIARMKSLQGWIEPGQRPEFTEFTVVINGVVHVEFEGGAMDVHPGQAVITRPGEWIRYSTPEADGAEYVAVCLPAFSPDTVHRDGESTNPQNSGPDSTAVRVALWRALHVQVDSPPHIIEDEIGLRLADPPAGWRDRPDMEPNSTRLFRASIVARARFIDDLVTEQVSQGVSQYVILGAGLDTFAERKTEISSKLQIFEVDKAGTQAWKQQRLTEIGLAIPKGLHFVPVDFEKGSSWLDQLDAAGFDRDKPAIVSSTGVTMYLTKEAIADTLRRIATLAPRSTLAMTCLLPMELADPEERPGREMAEKGARASGTPFMSFFTPEEMVSLAHEAGFRAARHVSAADLARRYFTGRSDGLRLSKSEELLIATT